LLKKSGPPVFFFNFFEKVVWCGGGGDFQGEKDYLVAEAGWWERVLLLESFGGEAGKKRALVTFFLV
jgi:hypothetical protein